MIPDKLYERTTLWHTAASSAVSVSAGQEHTLRGLFYEGICGGVHSCSHTEACDFKCKGWYREYVADEQCGLLADTGPEGATPGQAASLSQADDTYG